MLRYGFYPHVSRDRLYDTEDLGRFWDGVYHDGVATSANFGGLFTASPHGLGVTIGPGFMWYNHSYLYNTDDLEVFIGQNNDPTKSRYDYIVAEFNSTDRRNTIKVVRGEEVQNGSELYPELEVYQIPICIVHIVESQTEIDILDIETLIGLSTNIIHPPLGVSVSSDAVLFLINAYDEYVEELNNLWNNYESRLSTLEDDYRPPVKNVVPNGGMRVIGYGSEVQSHNGLKQPSFVVPGSSNYYFGFKAGEKLHSERRYNAGIPYTRYTHAVQPDLYTIIGNLGLVSNDTNWNTDNGIKSYDPTYRLTGAGSFKTVFDGSGTHTVYCYGVLGFSEGDVYRCTAHIRTTNTVYNARAGVSWVKPGDLTLYQEYSDIGTLVGDVWNTVSWDIYVPDGVSKATIIPYYLASGYASVGNTVWVDSVTVIKVTNNITTNGDFELSTSPWTCYHAQAGYPISTQTQKKLGTSSIMGIASGTGQFSFTVGAAERPTVVAGRKYLIEMWARASSNNPIQTTVVWKGPGDALISIESSPSFTAPNSWVYTSYIFTAPSGVEKMEPRFVQTVSNGVNNTSYFMDKVIIKELDMSDTSKDFYIEFPIYVDELVPVGDITTMTMSTNIRSNVAGLMYIDILKFDRSVRVSPVKTLYYDNYSQEWLHLTTKIDETDLMKFDGGFIMNVRPRVNSGFTQNPLKMLFGDVSGDFIDLSSIAITINQGDFDRDAQEVSYGEEVLRTSRIAIAEAFQLLVKCTQAGGGGTMVLPTPYGSHVGYYATNVSITDVTVMGYLATVTNSYFNGKDMVVNLSWSDPAAVSGKTYIATGKWTITGSRLIVS